MNIRTILIIVVLCLVSVFAVLNWSVIMAPTTLSMVFTNIEAPLGLIMLGLIILLVMLFLTFIVYLQANIMADRRRMSRELDTQRELANQAEASRFNELRSFLEQAFKTQNQTVVESCNGLSAGIGELEDRLERKLDAK